MDVAVRREMTVDEFLLWEEGQEGRWEFDGFEPVAMVGGTVAHARICRNLGAELTRQLRGGPCEAFSEGLKVMAADRVRYPDVFVACGGNDNAATVAANPVVVFEVLSPGTASTDMIVKNREYRATPSIVRYVVLAQDKVGASVFERRGADWVATFLTEAEAVLDLPEIGASVALAAVYEGVFPAP